MNKSLPIPPTPDWYTVYADRAPEYIFPGLPDDIIHHWEQYREESAANFRAKQYREDITHLYTNIRVVKEPEKALPMDFSEYSTEGPRVVDLDEDDLPWSEGEF